MKPSLEQAEAKAQAAHRKLTRGICGSWDSVLFLHELRDALRDVERYHRWKRKPPHERDVEEGSEEWEEAQREVDALIRRHNRNDYDYEECEDVVEPKGPGVTHNTCNLAQGHTCCHASFGERAYRVWRRS